MPSVHVGSIIHAFGQLPPQSIPSSSPFFIPSSHVGFVGHGGQLPPQSIPVSSPFWMPSVHVGFNTQSVSS